MGSSLYGGHCKCGVSTSSPTARGGKIAAVTSRDRIAAFIEELVPAIGMKAYGEPQIVHFAEHNPEAAGYTLIQLIETSSITAHFVDRSRRFLPRRVLVPGL